MPLHAKAYHADITIIDSIKHILLSVTIHHSIVKKLKIGIIDHENYRVIHPIL